MPGFFLRRVLTPSVGVFVIPFIAYLAFGALLAFRYESIAGDALSRVGSAYYILFSRDPHLGAIGFVWNPLPALSFLPLVALGSIWRPLIEIGFAANIMSAFMMAAACYQLWATLADLGVPHGRRAFFTGLFALHPLILISGADGMGEAQFLFFMIVAVRYLMRWIRRQTLSALAICGCALALAYLVRIEGAVAALGAAALVAYASAVRSPGPWRWRVSSSIADALIVGTPVAAAVATWATLSWLIVGSPFEQLTSVYGTASQVRAGVGANIGSISGGDAINGLVWLLRLEPFAPVLAVTGMIAVVRRRDFSLAAPITVYGGVLVFEVAAWIMGVTTGVLRYYVVVIPLAVLLCAPLLTEPDPKRGLPHQGGRSMAWLTKVLRRSISIASGVMLAIGVLSTGAVMMDSKIAPEEEALLRPIAHNIQAWPEGQRIPEVRRVHREIAKSIDQLAADRGSVIVDAFYGFPTIMLSDHPDRLVITTDRDFQARLADPQGFRVRYLLVPPKVDYGQLDAINRKYPELYKNGAGVAQLLRTFTSYREDLRYRLYEVLGLGQASAR